ncbi:MAG: DUF3127 domain-containing protein [Saprospiraceae bacterium]|nr:DUF3127 domain-containing protein [Saprospiraceae bacterium]
MSEAKLFSEGTIIKIDDTQQVTDKFKKRQLVIETDENYSQKVAFEFVQDRCNVPDSYKVGDKVRVHFNISGREWNGKYFVNLRGWRIESMNEVQQQSAPAGEDVPFPSADAAPSKEYDDDLPF